MPLVRKVRGGRGRGHASDEDESTPICRCRVLYLGSAVPHITKDGLQGIQEPLKELYPDTGLSSLKGIDSWLSVWSNGLLLENVDEKNTKITRFFPIESLHYCAAVRNVLVPASSTGPSSSEKVQKFLPLDSPFARLPNLNHPPLFACILRRTTGIKVLECHAFICKREMAANALVRCCFHAYADSTYAKQLENGGSLPAGNGTMMSNGFSNGGSGTMFKDSDRPIQRSVTPLNSIEKVAGWQALSQNGDSDIIVVANSTDDEFTDGPVGASTPRDKFEFRAEFPDDDEIYDVDENHKVWGMGGSAMGQNGSSELVYLEPDGTLKSVKSHGSRLSRPRQFISPPPPPPPPPQQFSLLKSAEDEASSSKKKTKKKLKKEGKAMQGGRYLVRPASMMNLSSGQALQPPINPRPGSSVINGPNNRPSSAMSTLTRSRHMHPHQQFIPVQQGGNGMNGFVMADMRGQAIYGHLPPPHFQMGPQMAPQLLRAPLPKSKKKPGKQPGGMLMAPLPLLHPGMPMNPTPPPPPMFHHKSMDEGKKGEMMMMPHSHYATIERGYHYHSRQPNGDSATLASNKSKSKTSSKNDPGGSPFNTGIYRKKGHLNERAFSYSIRQEHRSRSYGSLANLQFANESGQALRPSGSPPHTAEGMKKEREIIQMVRDLDLSGDEIERSQVPSDMYPPRKMNGYRQQNGHGPRITHR